MIGIYLITNTELNKHYVGKSLNIEESVISMFFFEDIMKYMNMSYEQLNIFLWRIPRKAYEKYNIFIQRDCDSYNEYVSFCKWDTDFSDTSEIEVKTIDDISEYIDYKKAI